MTTVAKRSFAKRAVPLLGVFMVVAACDGETQSQPPALASLQWLDGYAAAVEGDQTLECRLEFLLELSGVIAETDTYREYAGILGGSGGRTIVSPDGSGFSLVGDYFAMVRVTHTYPDDVRIENTNIVPPPAGERENFWYELDLLTGTLDRDGAISGAWLCVPFFTDLGGFEDDTIYAEGSWVTSAAE